jgi:hypothetical protein
MADTVVHWFWAIMGTFALASIAYFAISAWRSSSADALYWRGIKVAASALGVVGLALLLLNFEQLVRMSMVDNANDYAFKTFLEAKFYSTFHAAVACSGEMETQDSRNRCFDFLNLNGQVDLSRLRSGHMQKMSNWQKNPKLDPVIERLSSYIGSINSGGRMLTIAPTFGFDQRLSISLFSTLLVILAIAESIYQFKQERDKRLKPAIV